MDTDIFLQNVTHAIKRAGVKRKLDIKGKRLLNMFVMHAVY